MCYFLDLGQFASTPSEPATERAIHTFACKTLWRLSPAVQILFLRCPWTTDSTPFIRSRWALWGAKITRSEAFGWEKLHESMKKLFLIINEIKQKKISFLAQP